MSFLIKIKNMFQKKNTTDDDVKLKTSPPDLQELMKDKFPITIREAEYEYVSVGVPELLFSPSDPAAERENVEVRRLKNLAAKTKNKRIKKKLDKRIVKEKCENEV